jgi:hypothetical protein
MTRHQDRKRCRAYYRANAESIKAKRRARYRAKVLQWAKKVGQGGLSHD